LDLVRGAQGFVPRSGGDGRSSIGPMAFGDDVGHCWPGFGRQNRPPRIPDFSYSPNSTPWRPSPTDSTFCYRRRTASKTRNASQCGWRLLTLPCNSQNAIRAEQMAAPTLDQVVKGSPPTDTNLSAVAAAGNALPASERTGGGGTPRSSPGPADPTSLLPSSPPQIYLNLLILEASLRSQFLALRARRRQNTFVLTLLGVWIAYFFYTQYLRPRDDGNGVGGNKFWVFDIGEKIALISGCVMGILFWATGQWERGVRWPRRWLGTTNRGLRTMNCKIVVLKGPWWKEMISHLSFLLPVSSLFPTPGSSYHYIDYSATEKRQMMQSSRPRAVYKEGVRYDTVEEDVAPGGDYIKIMLLPKHFTPDFRENWESYRMEYWEQENQRRSDLRKRIRARQKEIARQEGGWLWWTGWKGWAKTLGFGSPHPQHDIEKPQQHHVHSTQHQASLRDRPHKRRPSILKDRDGSHSRSSSRSSTSPTPESEERERRWSTSTTGSTGTGRRRKGISTDMGRSGSITSRPIKLTPANHTGSRPTTPTTTSTLRSQPSYSSTISSSTDSSDGRTARRNSPEVMIKVEPAE
jgi:uncharacterized protein YeaO (DUF488 family)